jgi:hypothetical protein
VGHHSYWTPDPDEYLWYVSVDLEIGDHVEVVLLYSHFFIILASWLSSFKNLGQRVVEKIVKGVIHLQQTGIQTW